MDEKETFGTPHQTDFTVKAEDNKQIKKKNILRLRLQL